MKNAVATSGQILRALEAHGLAASVTTDLPGLVIVQLADVPSMVMADDLAVRVTVNGKFWSNFGSALDDAAEFIAKRWPGIRVGDEVRFRAEFLRSTGQYVGPEAPTHVGPFARGTVVAHGRDAGLPQHLTVRFEDGWTQHVHSGNLEAVR